MPSLLSSVKQTFLLREIPKESQLIRRLKIEDVHTRPSTRQICFFDVGLATERIHLVNGSLTAGRLEVYHKNSWGTV